jgi:aspartate aminotransferase-like enzyme
LRERYNIELQGGQGALADRMLRIGHMGFVRPSDIEEVLAALAELSPELGLAHATVGAGAIA